MSFQILSFESPWDLVLLILFPSGWFFRFLALLCCDCFVLFVLLLLALFSCGELALGRRSLLILLVFSIFFAISYIRFFFCFVGLSFKYTRSTMLIFSGWILGLMVSKFFGQITNSYEFSWNPISWIKLFLLLGLLYTFWGGAIWFFRWCCGEFFLSLFVFYWDRVNQYFKSTLTVSPVSILLLYLGWMWLWGCLVDVDAFGGGCRVLGLGL